MSYSIEHFVLLITVYTDDEQTRASEGDKCSHKPGCLVCYQCDMLDWLNSQR